MSFTNLEQPTTKKQMRVLMVTGIYPTEERPHSGTFIKSQVDSLIEAGLAIEIIHPSPGPVVFRYVSAALQVLLKTLTKQFDIVHGHYGQWCLIARLQATTAVVASFLGDDLLGTPMANGGYSKVSLLIVRLSRWLCRRVDVVIVKSEAMKKVTNLDNVFVIPNGVDFDLFQPIPRLEARAALGWDQDGYYVLFGNDPHIPRKGFPLAQASIERLRDRGISAELVVANGLPQTKVVQYINASNALILSSISEGSPNIVKEAMACNVPVVSTNVGDVIEIIGHTKGCKVCPSDPEALAEALEVALRQKERTTGRTDIAHLECSAVAQQVIAVYQQILSRRQRKGFSLQGGKI